MKKTIEQLHADQIAARRNLSAKRRALDEATRAVEAAARETAAADVAVNAALEDEADRADQAPQAGKDVAFDAAKASLDQAIAKQNAAKPGANA